MTRFEDIAKVHQEVPLGYARGAALPWWLKLGAKVAPARVPVGYGVWASLGVFRHSRAGGDRMRLLKGGRKYVRAAEALTGQTPRVVVELGPGDSVAGPWSPSRSA